MSSTNHFFDFPVGSMINLSCFVKDGIEAYTQSEQTLSPIKDTKLPIEPCNVLFCAGYNCSSDVIDDRLQTSKCYFGLEIFTGKSLEKETQLFLNLNLAKSQLCLSRKGLRDPPLKKRRKLDNDNTPFYNFLSHGSFPSQLLEPEFGVGDYDFWQLTVDLKSGALTKVKRDKEERFHLHSQLRYKCFNGYHSIKLSGTNLKWRFETQLDRSTVRIDNGELFCVRRNSQQTLLVQSFSRLNKNSSLYNQRHYSKMNWETEVPMNEAYYSSKCPDGPIVVSFSYPFMFIAVNNKIIMINRNSGYLLGIDDRIASARLSIISMTASSTNIFLLTTKAIKFISVNELADHLTEDYAINKATNDLKQISLKNPPSNSQSNSNAVWTTLFYLTDLTNQDMTYYPQFYVARDEILYITFTKDNISNNSTLVLIDLSTFKAQVYSIPVNKITWLVDTSRRVYALSNEFLQDLVMSNTFSKEDTIFSYKHTARDKIDE